MRFPAIVLLAALCGAQSTQGLPGSQWTLTSPDGSVAQGGLERLAEGKAFRASRAGKDAGEARPFPRGTLVLLTRDGQKIPGVSAGSEDSEVIGWSHPTVGRLNLPIKVVRGIERVERPGGVGGSGPASSEAAGGATEDVVVLTNGDRVRGVVTAVASDKLTLSPANGDPVSLNWSSVSRLSLADLGGSAAEAGAGEGGRESGAFYLLDLSDSTRLRGDALGLEGDAVMLGTTRVSLRSVRRIERVGPEVWPLSLLAPTEVARRPYLTVTPSVQWGEVSVMAGGTGGGARRFEQGIAASAYTKLTWRRPEGVSRLKFNYGLEQPARVGSAVVRVRTSGEGGEKVVFESSPMESGRVYEAEVDLGMSSRLTLEVDFGTSAGVMSRVVIGEPLLLK